MTAKLSDGLMPHEGFTLESVQGLANSATCTWTDGHPEPWHTEAGPDGTWAVVDGVGITVATGMRRVVADLLAELPEELAQAIADYDDNSIVRTWDEDDTREEIEVDLTVLTARVDPYPEAIPD